MWPLRALRSHGITHLLCNSLVPLCCSEMRSSVSKAQQVARALSLWPTWSLQQKASFPVLTSLGQAVKVGHKCQNPGAQTHLPCHL